MKNVTISLDEGLARAARIEAASQGKSLSRFVSDILADRLRTREAIRSFLEGPLWPLTDEQGRLPSREEIYAEREDELLRRHERHTLQPGHAAGRKKDEGA